MRARTAVRRKGTAGLLAMFALGFAASCAPNNGAKTTATFAEAPGPSGVPDYIFPLTPPSALTAANVYQFQYLMYRPLYWFGQDGRVQLNDTLSLAAEPQFSSDGRSVTITLKSYAWSDGTPVTTRDIEFWMNLLKADETKWGGYAYGQFPDNVTAMRIVSGTTMTFQLSQPFGKYFYTYSELSQIIPIPQHVWDKESATQKVGDYDTTPAGAQAVYAYLDAQSRSLATYNTNPLWQVVDGPWKLKHIDRSGNVRMVPNTRYSGPVKAKLAEFDEMAFSSDGAELNQLKAGPNASGAIDVGYLPYEDATQRSSIDSLGYSFAAWSGWQITYIPENFTNPISGPIFQQLYFRQAMQMLIDQKALVSSVFAGYATPTYGPVPAQSASAFLDSFEKANPYPHDPGRAVTLLQQHGWTVAPGAISTCTSPGNGPTQCGNGVRAGAQASFHLEYLSSDPAIQSEVTQLRSAMAPAGIQLNISTNTYDQVLGNATPCHAGTPCAWDMEYWGGGWVYYPDYYPTGELAFFTGGSGNYSGYTDPAADQLIAATESANTLQALQAYEDYIAKVLPAIWLPTPDVQLAEINSGLRGVTPLDPLLQIYPETWSWAS